MPEQIRILLVDDGVETAGHLAQLAAQDKIFPEPELSHVKDAQAAVKAALAGPFDVALFAIPENEDTPASYFTQFKERVGDLPIIPLLKNQNASVFKTLMDAGAEDCLSFDQITPPLLARSLCFTVAQKQHRDKVNALTDKVQETNIALDRAVSRVNQLQKIDNAARIARDEFFTKLCQEVCTPLNGIIPMASMLLETELNFEQRDLVQTISSSADALMLIISDMLDMSKLNEDDCDLAVVDFDLRTTLEEINNLLSLKSRDKGLNYACLIESEVPSFVRGDPTRFRQILTHLVGVAVDSTNRGEVVLNISLEDEDDERAYIRFAVNDTAEGVSQQTLDQLFKENSEVEPPVLSDVDDQTAGLLIAKRLVEAMGGQIGGLSEPGSGNTFWFTVILEKQLIEDVAAGDIALTLQNERVLVVDHSATVRQTCEMMLQAWNCRFEGAIDATSALAILQQAVENSDPFSLALIDMQLPRVGGKELGRIITREGKYRETDLILMTTPIHRCNAVELKNFGFCKNITKPIRRKQLFDTLVMVLNRESRALLPEPGGTPSVATAYFMHEVNKLKLRILIAEHTPEGTGPDQQTTGKMMGKLGYKIDVVDNGLKAIRALIAADYDLVLMDVAMPEMDGVQAAQIIRDPNSEVRNHDLPVIAIMDPALKQDEKQYLDAGISDCITKPTDPDQLVAAIDKWGMDAMP
ncbi:MAG: response regulator [Myxococcota bacterium]|nr:response regulator [Myxococcota bacterium]